jgi:histidinol-phosphate/aromatic aminotransferase/cobyric acid decarboxylase-like protein
MNSNLKKLGTDPFPNFVLCHLPENGPDADTLVARCREQGLFLRNVATMGTCFGSRAVRLAVKDAETNRRMVKIVFEALGIRA